LSAKNPDFGKGCQQLSTENPKFGKAAGICRQRIPNRDEDLNFPYLLTSATDVAGGKWKLSRITGAQGEKTALTYDAQGNLTKTVSPDGSRSTHYKRDLFGLETGRTFGGGMNSRTERDSQGRVVGRKFEKTNRYIKEKSYLWPRMTGFSKS
jgi:YD repeat-containing protein